jgi:hypothetical protein
LSSEIRIPEAWTEAPVVRFGAQLWLRFMDKSNPSPAPLDYQTPRPRRPARAPARFGHGVAIVIALITLWGYRVPGGTDTVFCATVPAWGALLVWWGILGLRWLVVSPYDRVPSPQSRWLMLPAAALITWLLVATAVPMRLGFAISRSALAAVVDGKRSPDGWAGVYKLKGTSTEDGGIWVIVGRPPAGPFDMALSGFAYFPSGAPTPVSSVDYVALGDGWYAFVFID